MNMASDVEKQYEAIIVFSGVSDLKVLNILKPGFRHCFTIINYGCVWIQCDPLAHRMKLDLLPSEAMQRLISNYRSKGLAVVASHVRNPPIKLAPIRPFTCVEAVKRLLGMRAPKVTTPWQLYCYLHQEAKSR